MNPRWFDVADEEHQHAASYLILDLDKRVLVRRLNPPFNHLVEEAHRVLGPERDAVDVREAFEMAPELTLEVRRQLLQEGPTLLVARVQLITHGANSACPRRRCLPLERAPQALEPRRSDRAHASPLRFGRSPREATIPTLRCQA